MVATAFLNMAYGWLDKKGRKLLVYLGNSILVQRGESIREYLQPDEKQHWKSNMERNIQIQELYRGGGNKVLVF